MPTPTRRVKLAATGALALALATTALTPWSFRAEAQPAAPAAPGTAIALPRPAGPDFADLAARVGPAVVRVTVTGHARVQGVADLPPELRGTPFERFFQQRMQGERPHRTMGQGSGFIIDPSGYVVTNNHVVGEADSVRIELADGRDLPAKVIGTDPKTDIALLKIEAGNNLPTVKFGDSDRTRVGEWVLAMGNPFGLGGTATAGIVSARGRSIGAGPYDDFIQTDAPINPGNSGGPLFNTAGEVVGVNAAIFSPSGGNVGIGFAVPANLAQSVVEQLRASGKVERGWLGVSMQKLDGELASALSLQESKGVLIGGVERNGPAAKAGVQPGDVVTAVNDRQVVLPRDLAEAVAGVKPGGSVTLHLLRDGKPVTQSVTLGQAPDTREARANGEERQSQANLGLALAPNEHGEGAVVAQVRPDSVAAEQGLEPGDVILRAGGKAVRGPRDVVEAVGAARHDGKAAIALQVEREGGRAFIALPLKAS
ncbi:DegQ family serine endoprotease [Paracraurococcus lichenis]|uniref:Probable periplasmic serine endoprotease DegP-like n=1 Tax=Paracraurococcus lichenis TaxID=3064888 RepID=A0ABT9DWJ3_9PROT|nr:DegQ family serine endoprotease [Paracraurococcus sp. LOR1-02]MDO9708264.1 DegQ family serine endoprotease [Paracraurococcus sp. LOR1-02]